MYTCIHFNCNPFSRKNARFFSVFLYKLIYRSNLTLLFSPIHFLLLLISSNNNVS